MEKSDCFYLGYISKQRGFKGQLVAYLDVDNPHYYKELESVFVDINNKLTPFFVEQIQIDKKGFALISFQGATNEQAVALLKKELYLPLNQLPKLSANEYYLHELVDMEVIDKTHGSIGNVTEVINHSGNRMLLVMQGNTELLIPMHKDVLTKVDKASKQIFVEAPVGLIDLYINPDDESI